MSNQYRNVLIAGATNETLGKKVTLSFLQRSEFKVFVLRTPSSNNKKKQEAFRLLEDKGATIVDGNYDSSESLEKALKGIDVVFSMLAGDVVVTGQLALLNASTKVGVKRFFTSDYGMDLTYVKKGDVEYYDNKLQVQEAVKKSNIEYTFVATGVFAEFLYSPFFGFDWKNHKVEVYGSDETTIYTTYTEDIAKLLPDILLNPDSKNNYVKIVSHIVTLDQAIKAFEKATNSKIERSYVSKETLEENFKKVHGIEQTPYFCKLMYINGSSVPNPPFNIIHPELAKIKTMSIEDIAETFCKDSN